MRLFRRKGHAVAKWRERARMIDPKKTRLTIIRTKDAHRRLPSWVYEKYAPQYLAAKVE
ncbi:MAG: hypothetical protein NWF09_06010 [Candidatus Bathyarchaeota archaeon]|nr:hypothetical protein [Candidatus Bathyarchaeota archaeon]